MALPYLSGSRRLRLAGIAILLTFLVFFLGQHATIPDQARAAVPGSRGHGAQEATSTATATATATAKPNGGSDPRPTLGNAFPIPTSEGLDEEKVDGGPVPVGTDGFALKEQEATPALPPDEAKAEPAPEPEPVPTCLNFLALQNQRPEPYSEGKRQFPYVRPPPECRTFKLPAMEALIERMKGVIKDPDLFRLFENSYPNTLDTMIKWRGFANATDSFSGESAVTDEELTYVITGDIDAMWLRDSASQVYSYLPLLEPSSDPDSLASLWRGLINAHARYIVISPYCHSFQPPPESGIPPTTNGAYSVNHPNPPYNPLEVFDCKWELDSLASFLQISAAYLARTNDLKFFAKYSWIKAVRAAVQAAADMRLGTYDAEGRVKRSAWTFTGYTDRGSETLTNDGLGNPVKENGMVRSGFRPSDDACIFQLLTPSNMMFAAYLEQASDIAEGLEADGNEEAVNLTVLMRDLAFGIRSGIARDAVVPHRDFGDMFAYEVDGFGSANLMDDANIPSLLAMPLWNFAQTDARARNATIVKSIRGHSVARHSNETLTSEAEEQKSEQKAEEKADEKEQQLKLPQNDYSRVYQNTRAFVLSSANPYFAKGPALSAIGGPHLGPGKGWPMAAIVAGLTAYDALSGLGSEPDRDKVVAEQLFMVLNSTGGTGVIHETVNAWQENDWTRAWFGWANGLFGELILRIADDEEKRKIPSGQGILGRSWQE